MKKEHHFLFGKPKLCQGRSTPSSEIEQEILYWGIQVYQLPTIGLMSLSTIMLKLRQFLDRPNRTNKPPMPLPRFKCCVHRENAGGPGIYRI